MKILVVQTNTYRLLLPSPLGAAMVAARLRRDGHQVRFLDLMFARAPVADAGAVAAEFKPDLACYSIRNRDNMDLRRYFDPIPQVAQVVAAIRRACGAPALLGGTAFTTFPARLLGATGAHWGLAGDDLEGVARFVRSLADGHPDLETAGLVYRDGSGRVVENPFRIVGYRGLPPDHWDFVDLRAYGRGLWQAGVVTRTGCPEQCLFCDAFRTFGREYVLRDAAEVAEELLVLKHTHRVRSVFLVDAGFNRPAEHGKEILRQIVRRGAQLRLYAILYPGQTDDELLALFRRAGGTSVVLFAEALSDPVLEALRKPFRAADVCRTAAALRHAGVPFVFMPTLGSPGETPETVRETLEGTPRLGAMFVGFGIGWRIQPRTALRERAVAEGLIAPEDDCYEPHFYVSPETPRAWLEAQVRRYSQRHALGLLRTLPPMLRIMVSRPWTWGPQTVA